MLCPLLPTVLALAVSDFRSAPPGFENALDRALDRAHEVVVDAVDLWVDHSSWETAWRVPSENYLVRTTHSRHLGLSTAQGLETMLASFQRILDTDYVPNRKFPVWIFPSIQEYNAFGNGQGADEHSSFFGAFYDATHPERPVATAYDPNHYLLYIHATHGAVHQFLDQAFGSGRPLWLEEGLAAYFSLYWDETWGPAELRRIVDEGRFVPLRQLLATQTLGEYRSYDQMHVRLIELGMFFTYLLHFREETRMDADADAPFVDYVRALLHNRDVSSLPFYQLFSSRLDELEEDLMAFDFGG